MKLDVYLAQKASNLLNKYIKLRADDENESWKNLFKNEIDEVSFNLDNDLKIVLFKDSIICKYIFEEFEKKEQVFISNFLKPDDIFFDIGANIGLHSLFGAKALDGSGQIYSFEPSKKTYERLNQNIELNKFNQIIFSIHAGISDTNGKLTLNVSNNGYDAWNSFAKLTQLTSLSHEEVEVIRLDHFIAAKNINVKKISLIKIDVEGWELKVLMGLDKILAKNNFNPCFLIEFTEENTFSAGYCCRDIYVYLQNVGYEWFNFDENTNSLHPSPLKPYYPYENLIAIKKGYLEASNQRLEKQKP